MLRKLYPVEQFPDGHTDLATSLNNMGSVLEPLGRLEDALEHYLQALAMYRKLYPVDKFPDSHADLATSLSNMGGMLLELGRYEQSVDYLERALALKCRLTDTLVLAASEGEAHALARAAGSSLSLYLSATQQRKDSAPATYAHVWNERSALTATLTQRLQATRLAAARNPEVRQCFQELQDKRLALAHLLQQPLPQNGDTLRARDRQVNELTQAKDALDRQLLRLLPDLAKQHPLHKLSPDALRQDLPENTAFVDVLRDYRWEFDPKKPGRAGTRMTPPCGVRGLPGSGCGTDRGG